MKPVQILGFLFLISLLVNVSLVAFYIPNEREQISELIAKTSLLSIRTMQLEQQLNLASISNQALPFSSEVSCTRPAPGGAGGTFFGTASMPAPAVSRSVRRIRNGPFIEQIVVMNGSVMNISVSLQPGTGRVLVETTPLMGIVFQDAANTAVQVARNRTDADLNATDISFSIQMDREVSAVDGSSAGTLMALLTIAAIEHQGIDPSVTLTGTISGDGHVGRIGGVVEKATAARQHGIIHFLIPRENSRITVYDPQVTEFRGFRMISYVSRSVEAKEYIEENIGLTTDYVDSIDDVLPFALR